MQYTLRPYQTDARDQILAAFADGCTDVYLDAPTGAGKTVIAYAVHEALQEAHPGSKSLYVPADKLLQRQFKDSFPDTPLLMGHSNYPSCANPEACTAKDTTECPCDPTRMFSRAGYVVHQIRTHHADPMDPALHLICEHAARRAIADSAPIANLNPWKYLYELPNYFTDRDLVIVDEADSLDSAVDDFFDRTMAISTLEKYGWVPPSPTATTEDVLVILRACYSTAHARYLAAQEAEDTPTPDPDTPFEDPKTLLAHVTQITNFGRDIAFQVSNAVLFWDDDNLTLRLISPAQALKEHAWARSRRRLHMTGSFGADPLKWAAHMGLPITPDLARVIRVPHQFPVENRLVHILPVEEMNWRAWAEPAKVDRLAKQIIALHDEHDRPRTLVHVTSRAQARALQERIPAALTYTENTRTSNKNVALQEAARRPHSILIAHSCHRGVDLSYDLCRLNIIAKVPFSNLDRSTRARQAADPAYYAWKTASTLVQALGRGVRAPDDYCDSYVLDATLSFDNWSGRQILMQFPDWVREAMR